jgi:hypothetical protein
LIRASGFTGCGKSGTDFSLCVFDLWQAKMKRTQAEACATQTLHSQNRNASQSTD